MSDDGGKSGRAHPGQLAPPPRLGGVATMVSRASHRLFRLVNAAMVPAHRAGGAVWLGNPATGWQCLVTTVGRRSGLPRPAPLGYIVMDGAAWVMAGYGPATHWYRNVLADPRVQLRLPGRAPMAAVALEVREPEVRARVIPPLTRSMALPGAVIGCFPPLATDERILGCVSFVPLVRIAAADGSAILPGPEDPGGRGWMWRQLTVAVAVVMLGLGIRVARRGASVPEDRP